MSASGRIPCSRKASTLVEPWRLDSGLPSLPFTCGTCAYAGGVPPSASITAAFLGALSSRSSPRITCVTPMSMSSTATASRKTGEPSERIRTKSFRSPGAHRTSPLTRSFVTHSRSGIRNRTACERPCASNARRSSSVRSRHGSFDVGRLLFNADVRRSSSSSSVQ